MCGCLYIIILYIIYIYTHTHDCKNIFKDKNLGHNYACSKLSYWKFLGLVQIRLTLILSGLNM